MRDLIFRAKRLDNGEWVMSGNIVHFNEDNLFYIAKQHDTCVHCDDECDNILSIEEGTFYKVNPETVGQFTDLTDSLGRKIFEGDIVKLTDKQYDTEWTAQVVFGNPYSEYSWGWNFLYIGKKPQINTDILLWVEMEETGVQCEVIGNIHDNPELLKGGADNGSM